MRGDLVRQHFLDAQTKKVRRIPAIRSGRHIAAKAGGSPRASMAGGATIGQPRSDRTVGVNVTLTVQGDGTDALGNRIFALKELTPAPDRPKRIACNVKNG